MRHPSDRLEKLVEALADARLRFQNLADGLYHGRGHEPRYDDARGWHSVALRDAHEGRDAINATLLAHSRGAEG